MKKIIRIIILLLLIAIIVVSSICLYKELSERKIQNDEYENLIMLFENVSDNHEDDFRNKNNLEADNLSSEEKVTSKSYNFDSIKNINSDVVGWIKIDGTEDFNYYWFTKAENQNQFNEYVRQCRSMSIFETGVQANYGDKLVTLVTCEYSQNNGRMIIVAKKI